MKWIVLVLAGAFLLPFCASAQTEAVPITAVSQRAHVAVNGGAMVQTQGEDWSGASLGGAIGYNLHQQFSVFAGYDHGFPVNSVDEDLNLYRAVGNLRVHPNAFVGFGYAWFDAPSAPAPTEPLPPADVEATDDAPARYALAQSSPSSNDTDGALVQLLLTKKVMKRVALNGLYAHIFTTGDVGDFEYLRVFVNYHLFGKE